MFDTHVTPASPSATILDPARGRALPAVGAPVAWGPYWANLVRRGDVVARPLAAEAEPPPAPEAPSAGPPDPDPAA